MTNDLSIFKQLIIFVANMSSIAIQVKERASKLKSQNLFYFKKPNLSTTDPFKFFYIVVYSPFLRIIAISCFHCHPHLIIVIVLCIHFKSFFLFFLCCIYFSFLLLYIFFYFSYIADNFLWHDRPLKVFTWVFLCTKTPFFACAFQQKAVIACCVLYLK